MQYKIIELLIQEDTFKLFTNPNLIPNLNTIATQIPTYASLTEFKNVLIEFFREIIVNCSDENLEYYESFKMLSFVERVFNEIPKADESSLDMTDEVINLYLEGLFDFVEGVDNEDIKRHISILMM